MVFCHDSLWSPINHRIFWCEPIFNVSDSKWFESLCLFLTCLLRNCLRHGPSAQINGSGIFPFMAKLNKIYVALCVIARGNSTNGSDRVIFICSMSKVSSGVDVHFKDPCLATLRIWEALVSE